MDESALEQSAIVASTSISRRYRKDRKHQARYDHVFKVFEEWCAKNNITDYSENTLCAYFVELSKKYMSSSLWSLYSMIKAELFRHHNVDMDEYCRLKRFLRHAEKGYEAKQSKALTQAQIDEFLKNAPDIKYLSIKAILLVGVTTGCGPGILIQLEVENIKDMGTHFSIALPAFYKRNPRKFIIEVGEYMRILREYSKTRPKNWCALRFFYRYWQGKGIKQVMGHHTVAAVPKIVAKYLGLSNSDEYTGQSMRRSSQAFNAGSSMKYIETVWVNDYRQQKEPEEEAEEDDEMEEVEEDEEVIDEYGEFTIMDTMPLIPSPEQEKQLGDSHKSDNDKKLPPEDSATNGTDVVVQREQDAVENGNTATPASMDATDMFFLSMARMTKRLPPLMQARVKHQVGDAVFNAEIESERSSVIP